jgi:acetyltransferase-like isoleucine patch superfamily enzyme
VIATHVNVGAMTTIGRDVLLMHNAVIGHDSRLGNNSIVLPGAWVGGHVTVGEDVLLGANSVTAPGLSIGSRCVLAPGAACLKPLPADSTLIGNPGRVVRR